MPTHQHLDQSVDTGPLLGVAAKIPGPVAGETTGDDLLSGSATLGASARRDPR